MGQSPRVGSLPGRTQPHQNPSLQPGRCRLLMEPPRLASLPNHQRSALSVISLFTATCILSVFQRCTIILYNCIYLHQVHQSISNVTGGGGSISGCVEGGTTSRHESTKGVLNLKNKKRLHLNIYLIYLL